MRSGQRFSYLALEPEETRALNAAYHERIAIPLDPPTLPDSPPFPQFSR
jgi:hypothetical protein